MKYASQYDDESCCGMNLLFKHAVLLNISIRILEIFGEYAY
ncbi:hypothetical protein BROSI_A3539 [Candidatus Brocadia sinica JPN1]|uniref:Uncharacterized protein n=1 Tax=Candidatus Brocadia sinica JPN1 TaxID=1197129 RepID=A0ABQ0K2J4_9BACT|nr:hypothetical protein BROSI_A3539 [Candidatus Brocadia sinica JPN1]